MYMLLVCMLISCSDCIPLIPLQGNNHRCVYVTNELATHGLLKDDLEYIMSNPSQTEWRLKSTPVQFYFDSLRKKKLE